MPDLVHRFQRLNAYERDSGGSILASLDSIPDAKRSGQPAIKAINLAAHIQAARLEWNLSVDSMIKGAKPSSSRWWAAINPATPAPTITTFSSIFYLQR